MKRAILIFMACCATVYANAQKGFNRIGLFYTPQQYFNKAYLEENKTRSENPLRPHNTKGHNFGLEFERVTRHGIIFNAGFMYGVERHDVDVVRDLSNFDPEAVNALRGQVFQLTVSGSYNYIAPRIMVGYRKAFNNKWAASAKVGVTRKMFLNGDWHNTQGAYMVFYGLDDKPSEGRGAGFLRLDYFLGDHKIENSSRRFHQSINVFLFYLGAEREFSLKYLKHITVGLEGTIAQLSNNSIDDGPRSGQYINAIAPKNWEQLSAQQSDHFWYTNKNYSLGLKIGLGLWK